MATKVKQAMADTVAPAPFKSQLVAMSGKVATVNPQSSVARLVHAELKGGEAKHNFIIAVISDAILQAYKGNTRDLPEAMKLCAGKAVKARAFHAGFHAVVDMVAPIAYKGKYDAASNANVRATIVAAAQHASLEFERAYLDTFAVAKAEALDKKAEKAAAAPALVADVAAAAAAAAPAPEVANVVAESIDVGDLIATVTDAISVGAVSGANMLLLRAALAAYDAKTEVITA